MTISGPLFGPPPTSIRLIAAAKTPPDKNILPLIDESDVWAISSPENPAERSIWDEFFFFAKFLGVAQRADGHRK